MDLGGASTQIAFEVQEDGTGEDYMHIQLYGYPYTVYTHSFLCYGKNEAEKTLLDKVLRVRELPSALARTGFLQRGGSAALRPAHVCRLIRPLMAS